MRVRFAGRALAVAVGALVSACGGSQEPASTEYSGEEGYAQCLQDSGFTDEEVALFTESGEPGEVGSEQTLDTEDQPDMDSLVAASAECAADAGIGESGLTPERIKEETAAAIAVVDCMRSHGWREFPDPVPGLGGGLTIPGAEIPDDAEQRTRFLEDFNECSLEHMGVPLGGEVEDEGNPVEQGPADSSQEHDHSDHDH